MESGYEMDIIYATVQMPMDAAGPIQETLSEEGNSSQLYVISGNNGV